jgi:UDPglucose--hexose-1-phosphate uridylyltransferase
MKNLFNPTEHPHRRFNPLLNEWILISPQRDNRPWQGHLEENTARSLSTYDQDCYLCPTNKRVNGKLNPDYKDTFVFDNDFAALKPDTPEYSDNDPLFALCSEQGVSRVICFSPDHSATLATLSEEKIVKVIDTWQQQTVELGQIYQWVQLFENKGEIMGCSNPHPHGQVWGQNQLPSLVKKKQKALFNYFQKHESNLLDDYASAEWDKQLRVVSHNCDWLVVVPHWAAWPFETLLLPRFHVERMSELTKTQKSTLGNIISQLLIRYDNLFSCSFPYSMGWHGAPFDNKDHPEWTLHASFLPPLLRNAQVRKFMVGYEMMAEPQRDITPELAAKRLRECSPIHYLDQ